MAKVQTFICRPERNGCGRMWTRPATAGKPPHTCPECRGVKSHRETRTETVEVEIVVEETEESESGLFVHPMVPAVLGALRDGDNVWLRGPAGSGKTTGAEVLAEQYGAPLTILSITPELSETRITGFVSPFSGDFHASVLKEAVEDGHLTLLDEGDNADPNVIMAANAILATRPGGTIYWPDGSTSIKHERFRAIVGANTDGRGLCARYPRIPVDTSFRDRFTFYEWGYVESFDRFLAKREGRADWADVIFKVRKALDATGAAGIDATPRATISGARKRARGVSVNDALDAVVFKGIDPDVRRSVLVAAGLSV